MKTLATRILLLILCVALPCGAMAQSTAPDRDVVYADFTLGVALHADGFPPVDAHLKAWQSFLSRLTLTGSMNVVDFLQQYDSRLYMEAAINIDDEETIPFTIDEYGNYYFLISPALRGDSTLFDMHSYFEFMLKPFFYLGLPTNYLALLTYPSAIWYIGQMYYTPISDMMAAAHESAVDADALSDNLTYTIPSDRLLALCGELNALITDDPNVQHVRRFLDVLLADLYISYDVLEVLSHTELLLYLLDPDGQGMTVEETAGGITCSFGDTVVFQKSTSAGSTDLRFQLPIAQNSRLHFTYRHEDLGGSASISAAASVTEGDETLLSLSAEGVGLPVEGALGGEGTVAFVLGGREVGDQPLRQSLSFQWSRTAPELPYDLDLTVSLLHPATERPAFSVSLSAAMAQSDWSVFERKEYPHQNFFGLNPVLLEEFKQRWGPTILAYLTPIALEMPIGVIDDLVAFLLDSDILISIVE